ncbi:hypothetical protein [Rhabdochromatium marinum]|uniref:hypothetical protein n=1 Tax=Rhabdochromatium marinum TaxID=48729 RepID=UPI001F5B5040|nr:hypothetical protein [Rhabdochromatium marinum]
MPDTQGEKQLAGIFSVAGAFDLECHEYRHLDRSPDGGADSNTITGYHAGSIGSARRYLLSACRRRKIPTARPASSDLVNQLDAGLVGRDTRAAYSAAVRADAAPDLEVEEHRGVRLVNGDALKAEKTANTNFAILNTVTMTEPLQDTAELGFDKLVPTLPTGPGVTPGDISFAYPGRIVRNLQESLELLTRVIPGVAHPSTTIYVPEIKFYDIRYPTSDDLETNLPGLFVAGDGAGKSRGIVGAAVNGIMAAKGILRAAGQAEREG